MIKKFTFALFFCLPVALTAQYSETFSTPNKGYLINNVNDFTGVDWTLSAWGGGRTATDYFQTTAAGMLECINLDEEVCWTSPLMTVIASGNISFTADLVWNDYDANQTGPLEFINVEYQINGGAWVRHPNVLGANGDPFYTVRYTGGGNNQDGSATTSFPSIAVTAGNSFQVRVCISNSSTEEITTIDNVNVSGVSTGCVPPTIGTATTQAGSCNGTNGTIKVTASGGTPGYNVAWSGPSSGNPGGTEIASSGGMYTITALTPGTYTITVTDMASCTATTTASITTATAISLGTQVLNTTCSTVNDGEIDLTVSNGVPPFSYSWSNLPGFPDPQDQTGLAPGTYTVTVTDNAGCTATTSATVAVSAPSAYLETFSIAGKGILDGSTCSGSNGTSCTNNNFAGVNWSIYGLTTLSGVDANDYFKTTGGKLEHKDIDQDVCWESPEIDINPPGSGIVFSVDLTWTDFDQEPPGPTPPDNVADHIDVEYSVNGGGWIRVPNQVGGGINPHTIVYADGTGPDNSGSITVNVSGLSGNTLRIRVCGLANGETELFTIDNVSVPGSNGLYCPCPTITFTATPTNTCSGSSNGQIAVTGVSGGTAPYMYSKDNGSNYQSGATFTGLAAGMYNVVVKDDNGCVSAASQVTVGTFSAPACMVTGPDFVCSNTENIVYSAPAGMSAYSWGISGAGSIPGSTTGSSVSVTSGNYPNNYTVSVTVTDGNGCTSTCSKLSDIFFLKPPADITANPNPVCVGAILDLSVNAAASSTVSWTGEGITNPSGNPSTTAIPTTAGPHVYTVTVTTNPQGCTNTGTVNVTVLASPTVFNITGGGSYCSGGPGVEIGLSGSEIGALYGLILDGNFLSSLPGTGNPLSFGLQTAAGTYQILAITNVICQVAMSGFANVSVQSCNVEFSGKIVWEDDDVSGVKDATVNVTGSGTGSDLTDINGDYSVVTTVTTGNFTLKPVKNLNKFNGVTAGDATAIQQHVTFINVITDPYKQVCADVNKSNSITTLDATLVVQALLGNPAANAIFNTSWRFVPLSWALSVPPWGFPEQLTYTGISGPQTNQDFVGMKIGDVTGSANPANFGSEPPLVLRTTDAVLQAGEQLELVLNADQKKDLAAFQFALNFDPAQLQFLNVQPLSALPLTTDAFGLYQVDAGEIRAVWAQATGLDVEDSAPMFRLQFQVLQSGAKLSEVLRLDDSILPSLSYTGALAESDVQLKYSETSGIDPLESAAANMQLQNRPNPFNQSTTISFVLPEATEAQLRIFDAGGRLVWERNKAYPAGYNEEAVQLEGVSGVLSYELVTPLGTATRRMVRAGN